MAKNSLVLCGGKAPCLGCGDRKIGCHSLCSLYIQYCEERARERKEKYDTLELHLALNKSINKWRTMEIKKNQKRGR